VTEQQTAELKSSGTPATAPSPPAALANGDAEKTGNRKKRLVRIGVVLALLVAAFVLWRVLRGPDIPEGIVALSGTLKSGYRLQKRRVGNSLPALRSG